MQLCIDARVTVPFCKRTPRALYALANSIRSAPPSVSRALKRKPTVFVVSDLHRITVPRLFSREHLIYITVNPPFLLLAAVRRPREDASGSLCRTGARWSRGRQYSDPGRSL